MEYKFGSMRVRNSRITPIRKSDLHLLQQKDERGISEDLPQHTIKEYVPEQLKRQMFSLQLNEGTYSVSYDPLGQHLLGYSSAGHLFILRLSDSELIAEKKLTEPIRHALFMTDSVIAVAVAARVVVFDSQLLILHNLYTSSCISMTYLPRHMLLVTAHEASLKYTDITNGKEIASVPLDQCPCKIAMHPTTALVAVAFVNSSVVKFYSPNRTEPLYAVQTGILVRDIKFYEHHLVVFGQDFLKIMDCGKWSGLEASVLLPPSEAPRAIEISQTGVLAILGRSQLTFQKLGPMLDRHRDESSLTVVTDSRGEQHYQLKPFLTHKTAASAASFRPYFDNCCVTSARCLQQLLVPGSGKAEIDTYKANVFASKRQRSEAEVKQQLNKLPYELIGENYLTQTEKPTDDEIVRRRYGALYAQMEGSGDTTQFKSMRAKEHRRLERLAVQKEVQELAQKLEAQRSDSRQAAKGKYLDKFKKLGKK